MATPAQSRKRKAEDELSTNPHTVKARKRKEGMTDDELAVEKAKNADQGAITYALQKLKKKPEWINASEEERIEMKKKSTEDTIHKRSVACFLFS